MRFNSNSKKTILNIVFVYLFTTISLLLSISYIYYNFAQKEFINSLSKENQTISNQIIEKLENLHFEHNHYDEPILYPTVLDKSSAIYDGDYKVIYSEFDSVKIDFSLEKQIVEHSIYYIYEVEPHYLGASFLVIENDYAKKTKRLQSNILVVILIVSIILILSSFIIAKLLIKPLQSNIRLLDEFIKDTTHELNTPVSAILNNIEMIDLDTIDDSTTKKIHRIKIASTTISTIYDDLSFLLLNNHKQSQNIDINISDVLKERIEYFEILLNSKKLNLKYEIEDDISLLIDKLKFERLIDNLISNAIKYSRPNKDIIITLTKDKFEIEDFGVGMSEENIKEIFTRYKRFNHQIGGFGIGYSIIKSIIDEYDMDIEIKSKSNQGTKVTLLWQI